MMIGPLPTYNASYSCDDTEQDTLRQSVAGEPLPATGPQHDSCNNPVLEQILQDLKDCQKEYGRVHPKVAEAWNALGLIRVHMERNADEARKCHEYALAIYKDLKLAKETAITLNDLGYCFERMNQRDMALRSYQEALLILEAERLSENHPRVISTRRAVFRILRE
jgi:tetratricopeptide (TPR) repeat protein